ncbi:MAG: hypothetical protein ACP5UI_04245 [Thermoprotei archaeon]|nr:hypothetical protein [TACK group archaeon]
MSEPQYPLYQCVKCGYVLTEEDWRASGLLVSKLKCPRCGGRVFLKLTYKSSRIEQVL